MNSILNNILNNLMFLIINYINKCYILNSFNIKNKKPIKLIKQTNWQYYRFGSFKYLSNSNNKMIYKNLTFCTQLINSVLYILISQSSEMFS